MSDRPDDPALPDGPSPEGAPHPGAPLTEAEAHQARVLARYERRRRRAQQAALGAAALVALAVVAVGALVAVLQTEYGRGRVQSVAVRQIENLLAEDATVEVARVEGNFLTGARLLGLVIRRDGEVVVQVDTVSVDYRLRTLIRRTFSAGTLYVAAPRVYVRQRPDSTFNTAGLIRPREAPREGRRGFTVEIDKMHLTRGRVEVRWHNPARDSVHVVRQLSARATAFHFSPDSLVGRLDTLRLSAIAPLSASRLDLAGRGAFSSERFQLDRFVASSSQGTRVRGRGRLVFRDGALPVFDADVEAAPLALADARAFAGVALFGDARARLVANSTGNTLTFGLRGALDDAAVVLDGELTADPDAGGPVRYRAEGSLRRLNPARLTGNPALAAQLNADLRADLAGRNLRSLSGPFALTLRESRLGEQAVTRAQLDGAFEAGRVAATLVAEVPGARVRARGSARPFERVPTFEASGRADELDLARLLPNVDAPAALSGDFAVEGRGHSAETLFGTAAVSLDRAVFGDLRLAGADLDADFQGGRIAFDADARFAGGGGRLLASGEADTRAEPLAYRVTSGRLQNVNLAALTGNPEQESDLSGTFTLEGRGTDPQTAVLNATARLASSRYGDFDLVAVSAQARLAAGQLTFDADADLGRAGGLAARGSARPFAEPIAYQASGQLRSVNLAALTGNPEQESDLSGTFTLEGRGTDPATLATTARLRLTASSYGAQRITGSDVTLRLAGGQLALAGAFETPEGQFALDVSGRPFDDFPTLAVGPATCFSGIDVGQLTGNPELETRLSGCFEGQLAGFSDLERATGEGVLTLRPSTINDAPVQRGAARFALAAGALGGTAQLVFGEAGAPAAGEATLAFQGRPFDEEPTYALRGTTRDLDLAALTRFGAAEAPDPQTFRLTASFDVAGRGFDPATADLAGAFFGGSSRIGPARIDTLAARFALAGGVLAVDELRLRSDIADADGGGRLALFNEDAASDFRLTAAVNDIAPLAVYTDEPLGLESGTLSLVAIGRPGRPLVLDAQLAARQFVYGPNAITGLDAQLAATVDLRADTLLNATTARLSGSFDALSTPALLVETGSAEVVLDAGTLTLDGTVVLDRDRDLAFFVRTDLDPDTPEPGVLVERGAFRLGSDTWQLAQPTRITTGETIEVRGLLLANRDGTQQLAVDGELDFNGEQNFIVTIDDVAVDGLTDLVRLEGLGGRLTGTLVLTGPAEEPLLDGTLRFEDLSSQGETFGSLDAAVAYAGGRLTLDAVLTHASGETLTVEGYLPRRFSLAGGDARLAEAALQDEVQFTVRADAFPVAWARPFLDARAYTDLGGILFADLTVTGTQGDPRLEGRATLTDGRLGLTATGLVYEPVQAALRFTGNRIEMEDVRIGGAPRGRAAADAPRLRVEGAVTLSELSVGELDLTITPVGFVAMNTPTFRRLALDRGSEPLRLTGTLDAPVLRGAVVVASGDIFLTDELVPPDLEPVTLSEADIRAVEARFGQRLAARDTAEVRFTDLLDYDLTVQFRRNVWIRSRGALPFDIEFEGNVQAVKAPFAEGTSLFGQIDLVRGSVQTLGRRFVVQPSAIVFNGPATEAQLDLAAVLNVRLQRGGQSQIQINLGLQGQLNDNPEVRLSSDPPLDPADIVSVIATGQLSDNLFAGAGGNLGGTLGNVALGQVTGLVEGFAGETFGLDLVEISVEGSELVIRIGKYLTDRAFLSFGYVPNETSSNRRGVGEGSRTEVSLEYQLLRWLALQAEQSNQRGTGAGLNYQFSW
ncbi:MAG: translocation/assembly module TamB domain-containing protein [Rubricoccaceae bacterium]